jgi:hypothetical protein
MTLSIRYRVDAGRIRPLARFTIINKKLALNNKRRGLISFQISGRIFLSFGFGREALSSADVALPVFREGLSAAFIPGAPKLEGPIECILVSSLRLRMAA